MGWRHHRSLCSLLLASAIMLAVAPAIAADVTPERLANPEPGNWLMNHRTYDGQRFSPLARINRDTVKGLKLAYAVPLGGGTGNEFNEATRSPKTASSTSPIPGACSTRSTAPRETRAASSGAWTRNRSSSARTAAPPCGPISSLRPPTVQGVSSPPIK